MGNKQSWSFIIFCYNEAGTVAEVIQKVANIGNRISPDFEIVIVDDGSSDGSTEIINAIEIPQIVVKKVIHERNKGIGWALYNGYINASKENVTAIPADGQFNVQELEKIRDFSSNEFISFYRVENLTYNLARNILSGINKYLNKILIGLDLKDVNWVKVFKTEVLQSLKLELRSSLIESEICAKLNKKKVKVIEIPSTYQPRVYGESKGASLFIVKKAIIDLFRLVPIIWGFKK